MQPWQHILAFPSVTGVYLVRDSNDYLKRSPKLSCYKDDCINFQILPQNTVSNSKYSKWVWSGNATITNCRQTRAIIMKSHITSWKYPLEAMQCSWWVPDVVQRLLRLIVLLDFSLFLILVIIFNRRENGLYQYSKWAKISPPAKRHLNGI